ncbi:hypothetical protein [Blastococcus sp. URHD0036]|uniref:hypothetical protein n=1 Tax=Blastococcus sp. URHD0036 TaxID=1380356 RepID=UPI00068F5C87|nr:hypothetical protein [Blastococcus sp. URHD0036]
MAQLGSARGGPGRTGEGPDVAHVPDGLPRLGAGAHLFPEAGACLMEYVSVLAGERFGDSPPCTDPALAMVARLVNDASTDAGRPALARLAPALAGAPPAGPVGGAAVALAALTAACGSAGEPAVLVRYRERARRRLERVTRSGSRAALARWTDPLYRLGPAQHRLGTAALLLRALPLERRDPALHGMLAAALTALPVAPVAPGVQLPAGRAITRTG